MLPLYARVRKYVPEIYTVTSSPGSGKLDRAIACPSRWPHQIVVQPLGVDSRPRLIEPRRPHYVEILPEPLTTYVVVTEWPAT